MKLYKINKWSMIYTILIGVTLTILLIFAVILEQRGDMFRAGVLAGTIAGFTFPLIMGVTRSALDKPAIEKVEVAEKNIKEN